MGWVQTEDKRERILNAAENCLKEKGLNNLNIRDVAREAGVSLGSVHYYFSGKEQMLVEIFRHFVARVSRATLSGKPDANPRQVLGDFLEGFFSELARDPNACQVFLDLWDHVTRHQESRELLESYYRKSLKFLTNLIREGKKQGLFHVEAPAQAALNIIAIIDGIKVQLHLFGPEMDLKKTKNACRKFIERALGA